MSETSVAGFRSPGQATAVRIARQSAERGEMGRTMLVHGPAGANKAAFVEDLLALIFCADPETRARPCNTCRGCLGARARTHPDLAIGSPEAWREARSTGESIVSAARRWLLHAAGAPIAAERRVVLLEGVDRANEQTQNALLKVLEEPTDRHTFILVADQPQRLLPTIRSRCRHLRIGSVPRAQLAAYLMDRMRLPADQADALAQVSGGLVGTAVGYAEEGKAGRLDWRRRVQGELLHLLRRGRADRLAAVRDLLDESARLAGPTSPPDSVDEGEAQRATGSAQREGALLVVDAWLALTRDLLVTSAGRPQRAQSRELLPDLEGAAAGVEPGSLMGMIAMLERIHEALRQNAAPRLALEAAMLRWPGLGTPRDPAR